MAEDPIRKYSSAVEEFNLAYSTVRKLGEIIADVGRYMNNRPHVFMVSNSSVGFPPEIGLSKSVFNLNADDWPSVNKIAEAMVSLYEKRQRVKEIYASLSATDKKLVQQPDLCEKS